MVDANNANFISCH